MILDSNLCFDAAVALTATRASTNVIDLSNSRDMGIGEELPIMIIGDGLFASAGGTATLQIAAQYSTDNVTYVDAALSPVMTIAQLNSTDGQPYLFPVDWPRPKKGSLLGALRYIRLYYTVGTQDFTAGSLQAYLVLGRQDVVYYPRNYSVSVN